MKIDKKREEIREKYFSTANLIIITILGIIGFLLMFYSGVFNIRDSISLYNCLSEKGVMILFGLFFFGISLYCWIAFFLNIVLKPKQEVLFFERIEDDLAVFIDKKGKKYNYEKKDYKVGHYYFAIKSVDYIFLVLEETIDNWTPNEKHSYWLNFYSAVGNYNDVFILPIAYLLLLPGLLSAILSEGTNKIYGIILSLGPAYLIIYDLIYKIKLKQSDNNQIDDTNFLKIHDALMRAIPVVVALYILVKVIETFLSFEDLVSKIIFIPAVGCVICTLGIFVSLFFEKQKLVQLFIKGYIIIFLLIWFGITTFATIAFIGEGYYQGLFITTIFYIFGLFVLYKYIIKK